MIEESSSKRYEAYRKIKDFILNHRLSPGQKLVYRDLEDKLKMTQTPIISGLAMLEQDGFVISKKNRGFYVSEVDARQAQSIFQLREKLEYIVIEWAIARHESTDLRKLKGKLSNYLNYGSPVYDNARRSLDTEFHLEIARMAKNDYLLEIMKQFYESIYFSINLVYLTPLIQIFKEEHKMLLDVIAKKDLKRAKSIVKDHNQRARDCLSSMI